MIATVLRMLASMCLIVCGGLVAVVLENAILGCLLSAGGVFSLAMPLIIETDEYIEQRNRQERLRQAWERNNG